MCSLKRGSSKAISCSIFIQKVSFRKYIAGVACLFIMNPLIWYSGGKTYKRKKKKLSKSSNPINKVKRIDQVPFLEVDS